MAKETRNRVCVGAVLIRVVNHGRDESALVLLGRRTANSTRTCGTCQAGISRPASRRSSVLRQLLARPMIRPNPYSTPAEGLYICSSSTPPGGSVHGLCGYLAARAALRRLGK